MRLDYEGDLPGFGEVYYHPNCLAQQKLVRFDDNKYIFIVNINEKEYELYVCNTRPDKRKISMVTQEMVLVDTVETMKNIITKRQQKDAALPARQAQMHMGYPSVKDIVEGINKSRVLNLLISKSDFDNAERIWRKDMGSIVRKSTRKRPSPVEIEQHI